MSLGLCRSALSIICIMRFVSQTEETAERKRICGEEPQAGTGFCQKNWSDKMRRQLSVWTDHRKMTQERKNSQRMNKKIFPHWVFWWWRCQVRTQHSEILPRCSFGSRSGHRSLVYSLLFYSCFPFSLPPSSLVTLFTQSFIQKRNVQPFFAHSWYCWDMAINI